MATITENIVSPDDLLTITDRPMPELVDGQLVERPLMGQKSDALAARLLIWIGPLVEQLGLGLVNGAQGSYQIFPDDPKKIRIPDISFIRSDRLPPGGPPEGHGRTVPDLVVEVISPNDMAEDLIAKIEDFLRAGVPLVWVLSPRSRVVYVYRKDGLLSLLRTGDTLDGEDILPGFQVEVDRLFAQFP